MIQVINEIQKYKAIKKHVCNLCCGEIENKETYLSETLKFDGNIYKFKMHLKCHYIADKLKMYEDADEGVDSNDFAVFVCDKYISILLDDLSPMDDKRHRNIKHQLEKVLFPHKLDFVIKHYKSIDQEQLKKMMEDERK